MTQLDPRLHAIREDLASASLQDRVRAPRYVKGEIKQVAAPTAPIRVAPRFDATLATEALMGELLTVYDIREGWAWVQLREDGYVGYTSADTLSNLIEENTHRVSARLTYLYPAPDVKRPPITKLSFSCTVAPISKPEGRFIELSRGGFIYADHLVGIKERAKDFVRVAERFVGVPYLWGGKTTLGIDCSGLVQIALQAAGMRCLRDTDMQLGSAGEPVDTSNLEAIQRGDLLFWKGHVAIAQSPDWIVHASEHYMEVVVEQLRHAIERLSETHGPLLAILRPALEKKPAVDEKAAQIQQAAPGQKPPAKAPPAASAPQDSKPAAVKETQSAQAQATRPNASPQPQKTNPQDGGKAGSPPQTGAGNAAGSGPSANVSKQQKIEAQQPANAGEKASAAQQETAKQTAKQSGAARA